ncbi:MAG TPA: hypothetical protein VEM41_05785 [Actinomycetota bacterium]|nr:hypothetical protein [Actinomycetota bacterium]
MRRALLWLLVVVLVLFMFHERDVHSPPTGALGGLPSASPTGGAGGGNHGNGTAGSPGSAGGSGAGPTPGPGSGGGRLSSPGGSPHRPSSAPPTRGSPTPEPSSPSPPPSPSPTPPGGGSETPSAWGVDAYSAPSSLIQRVQDVMGGGFEAFSDYEAWAGYRAWPARTTQMAERAHALVYLNINTHQQKGGRKVPICWRAIAAGLDDATVRAWASAIVRGGYQRHMVITIEHEPNVNDREQPKCAGDTPSDYRSMFDHVYHVMRSLGVTAPFAFVPTMSLYRTHQADAYLPPTGDIQVYGADVYNRVPRGAPGYHSAATDIATMLAWGDSRLPGRSLILGEIGDTRRDPAQGSWVTGVLQAAMANGHFLALDWNLTPGYLPLDGPGREAWLAWAHTWTA